MWGGVESECGVGWRVSVWVWRWVESEWGVGEGRWGGE